MMYIEQTPLEGNLNYILGQQESQAAASTTSLLVAARKNKVVEVQPRHHVGAHDSISKFIEKIKQINKEIEAANVADTSKVPYLNGDHIEGPPTSPKTEAVDAQEEEPPYDLVDVCEDDEDTTVVQHDTRPPPKEANKKVITVVEGFQVEVPSDSEEEIVDDETAYYTVNAQAENSAHISKTNTTFGTKPGITSTPLIQSKAFTACSPRPVPAAIPISAISNPTVHYRVTDHNCSVKLVSGKVKPKHLILNGRCGLSRSSDLSDEDDEDSSDSYQQAQMGIDLFNKIRTFFNLDRPIQQKKRKRPCEESPDSDNPPQQIKYRKVNNRFPKYVSSTLENDDLEAHQFHSFEQNNERNWQKSFTTHKPFAMAQRKPLHPFEPPKARKSMFVPPVVTHKAVKNFSYADIEFSDDEEPELINGFGVGSRDNFDGLGRSTGRATHIPIKRTEESYNAGAKPPPPLIPTKMGNVLGGVLPSERSCPRRATYADVLQQNHNRPMEAFGNVLGTGVRAGSSMSSTNASTSASAGGFKGLRNIRTNPWAKSQHSVLTLEKETEERRQYQALLNSLAPSIYDSNVSKSDNTLGAGRPSVTVDTTRYNSTATQRRSLAQHNRAVKQPQITSTIDLSSEDDDDDDVAIVNSMILKKPVRRPKKLVVDEDVTEVIDLSGDENATQVPKKRSSKLPYVEPVNSLQDQLRCLEPYSPDWLKNWIAKWSLTTEKHFAAVEEAKKKVKETEANRIAAENEMHERMKAFQIVDANLLVIDDFPEPDEVPEFVEFTKEQQDKINNAIYGPPDKVVVSKFNQNITRRDIHTLLGHNWLNDEVINFYMNLLTERGEKREELPRVYAMNTFFVQRLLQSGYSGVKRWTRKVDLFSKDIIPVPVHVGGVHWCMAIIDLMDRSIKYYDSMGSPNPSVLKALEQYLKDESMEKCGKMFDTSQFEIESVRDVPRQMNGSDCGVFSCMFAEYITRNRAITFSQQNMEYFRSRMILEIVQGELLH